MKMDIQLIKKPWYIRHISYLIAGASFIAFTVYICILAFGPRKLKIDSENYRIAEANVTPFMDSHNI